MKKRILVIDDDLAVCRSIRESMQDDHTDVYYAMSILEAPNAFAEYDHYLVIVDLRLSEADSIDILRMEFTAGLS